MDIAFISGFYQLWKYNLFLLQKNYLKSNVHFDLNTIKLSSERFTNWFKSSYCVGASVFNAEFHA